MICSPIFSRKLRRIGALDSFALLLACLLGTSCHASRNFLVELGEARATAVDLRLQFSQETDASNRAVMADTDEASIAFADEARAAAVHIENDRAALAQLLHDLNYPSELGALAEFDERWAAYDKLDRDILALAVENTNLKAQRLAFGPSREAASAFRAALESLTAVAAAKDRCQVEKIVDEATLAVREIQVLEPPHIAESSDEVMTRFEREMDAHKAAARAALSELATFTKPGTPALIAATVALDRFEAVGAQILKLSRRNTNVRSLDLALRVKPPLTAQCDASLRRLEDALAAEGSKATR